MIEPVGESKPNWDFFAEWGRRMGFKDQAFRDTPKDIIRQFLQTETPWYQGITLERLQKEKFIHLDMPESVPVRSGGKAETESGKIELYSNIMKKAGFDPVIDLTLKKRTCRSVFFLPESLSASIPLSITLNTFAPTTPMNVKSIRKMQNAWVLSPVTKFV